MKKLTPEEKEQRKQERIKFDAEESARAPGWSRYVRAGKDCTILAPGDSIWLRAVRGRDVLELEILRPGNAGGVKIDTIRFDMAPEKWAELADAAIRRVRWGQKRIEEILVAVMPQPETATLRDRLAMAALQAITPCVDRDLLPEVATDGEDYYHFDFFARQAYEFADAMMEARKTPGAATAPETP